MNYEKNFKLNNFKYLTENIGYDQELGNLREKLYNKFYILKRDKDIVITNFYYNKDIDSLSTLSNNWKVDSRKVDRIIIEENLSIKKMEKFRNNIVLNELTTHSLKNVMERSFYFGEIFNIFFPLLKKSNYIFNDIFNDEIINTLNISFKNLLISKTKDDLVRNFFSPYKKELKIKGINKYSLVNIIIFYE